MIYLTQGLHTNPHAILGKLGDVARIWRPGASEIYVEVDGKIIQAKQIDPSGFFEVEVTSDNYRIYHTDGTLARDPYVFSPTITKKDLQLFNEGTHYDLYKVMGARICTHEGVQGVAFSVWAPHAKRVSVVGDFNLWNGRVNPMRLLEDSGIWELFIPGIEPGQRYKFELIDSKGRMRLKSDPFAHRGEMRPKNASVVASVNNFVWSDKNWTKDRQLKKMVIYEVHLGSWKRDNGKFLNYRELAHQLVDYCKNMGFTHIELLPITEHPLDESWGYQVTGYFAVTNRFGTIEDFQYFVNYFHEHSLGVILDWIPAHFPNDVFGLNHFDGTALYEYDDPRQGFHPQWLTHIFDYRKPQVNNFLIASALFWLEQMHVDGLRVDAVSSMLYHDFGRGAGSWIPNKHGGSKNLEAVAFIKHLNHVVHERVPGALMIAEESSAFPGVTDPEGLGFDYKWNMGWMNDILRYIARPFENREAYHDELTFSIMYAFSEKFLLPFSHDEVVHEKKSLLAKMPGTTEQKFAGLILLYSYMICHPGKKLLFMGGEFGQWSEWNCNQELDWMVLDFPVHQKVQAAVRKYNEFYHATPDLWEDDFEWVDCRDQVNNVICYLRGNILVIHNFSPKKIDPYFISLKNLQKVSVCFGKDYRYIDELGISISLEPLSTQIFHVKFK